MDDDGNTEEGAGKRWEPRPDLIPPGILQPPTQAVPTTPEPEPTQAVPPVAPAPVSQPPTAAVPSVPSVPPPSGPPTPPQGQPPVDAGPPFGAGPPSTSVPTATPPPAGPDRRRQLIIAASSLGVVAALILGFVVFRAVTGDDDTATPSTSTSAPTSTSTSTTAPPLSGRVDLGQGITAIVPEGSLPAGATLEADPSQLPGEAAGTMVAVSPFVKIRVEGGEQQGPITLVFPVDAPAAATPESGDPVLVALHQGEGIEPVAGTYDVGAQTYTVTAESVDGWGVAGWIWDQVTDALDDAVSARTDGLADAADPSCEGGDATDLVEAVTNEGGPAWCAELADDGGRTLRLVNRLEHLVTVVWGEGTNAAPDGGGQLSDPLERWVDEADGTGSLALAPGEAAHVSIPADVEGTVDVSYDHVAHAATSLLTAADVVAATADLASFAGPASDAATVLGGVDVAACLGGAGTDSVEASVLTDVLAACFGQVTLAGTLDPKVATLVTPLLASAPVTATLADRWGSGVTAMTADAESTFTVATAAGPWPTDDQEADLSYSSWLLLDGFTANWSSCSGGLCIAGDGTQVRVDDVSGFEPEGLGTVPEDTTDARGALVALGLTDDEATALLTPGPA